MVAHTQMCECENLEEHYRHLMDTVGSNRHLERAG